MQPNGPPPPHTHTHPSLSLSFLVLLEGEEMRPGGGSRRSANHSLTLTPSITSRVGQSQERQESETADAAAVYQSRL